MDADSIPGMKADFFVTIYFWTLCIMPIRLSMLIQIRSVYHLQRNWPTRIWNRRKTHTNTLSPYVLMPWAIVLVFRLKKKPPKFCHFCSASQQWNVLLHMNWMVRVYIYHILGPLQVAPEVFLFFLCKIAVCTICVYI